MHRRSQISPSDLSAVRSIVARYYPRTAALGRVPSFNNLVIRLRQPAGATDKILKLSFAAPRAAAMAREPQVMALLRHNGIPVPLVEIEDMDGKLVGRPFFVMKSEGTRTASELSGLSGHNRRRLFREVGKTLARVHNIAFNAPADFNGHQPVAPHFRRAPLEAWHVRQLDYARRHRLFETSLLDRVQHTMAALPEARRFGMCHGDFNPSQCIRSGPAVRAIVDWEGSYIGDPIFDFAVYDALLETTAPRELAEASRHAYAELRPLPADYAEAFCPFKLAHVISLGASFHAKRRGGSMRSVRAALSRLCGDIPGPETNEVVASPGDDLEADPEVDVDFGDDDDVIPHVAVELPVDPAAPAQPPSIGRHA